jgi:drug/metabolite transporter (DMT)-like permease
MFLTISLIFLPTLFDGGISSTTVFYAALVGGLSFLYQIFYVMALSLGRMTLTVIINNFGMLVPMIVSVVVVGDTLTPFICIGAVLALVSLCLTVANKKGKKSAGVGEGAKWLILSILVFLTNGFAATAQKMYTARAGADFQIFEFVCIAYMFASAFCFAALAVSAPKEKRQGIKIADRKTVLLGACVGMALGIFQCVNTLAISLIPGSVYYPIYNCGVSLMLALIGAVLFKERFTLRQYIGIAIGVIAILLLCI